VERPGRGWEGTKLKSYIIPFAVAFVVCGLGFLILDVIIMRLHGLSLIFEG
jgi:hypothetical protein